MPYPSRDQIHLKVVGVGGAGCNAIQRMAKNGIKEIDLLAVNTDSQALAQLRGVSTFAIGPKTTKGMGSGGHPDVGRKAIKESQKQIGPLIEGSDMVFITAGMGGGTGTGAASVVANIAKKHGALTVGIVTMPMSFEGSRRKMVADDGLRRLQQKVDTLIIVDNQGLLHSLKDNVSVEEAFKKADDILLQGVKGISDLITEPGLVNVDFADVKSIMMNGGPAFMAVGEGKGKQAAQDAAHRALNNPLFSYPIYGSTGILLNIKCGKEMALAHVQEVAEIVRGASAVDPNVIFGVTQERRMKNRAVVTLVATGIPTSRNGMSSPKTVKEGISVDNSQHKKMMIAAAIDRQNVSQPVSIL